jgi:hypothetical protein
MAEEFDIAKELAELGLPDDLERVTLKDEAPPTPEAVARIKQMTMARVEQGAHDPARVPVLQPRRRRRWLGLVAAAAAGLLAVTGILGPKNVLAEVQRLLSYVPGFGTRAPDAVQLAAAAPVRLERGDRWVEVAGVLADQDSITVHIMSQDVGLDAENVSLAVEGLPLDRDGTNLTRAVGDLSRYDGWYTFNGKVGPDLDQLVVVVGDSEPWKLTVPLVAADRLAPVADFSPAAVINGYTVQAQVRSDTNRADLTLLVRGGVPGSRVSGTGYSQPVTLSAGPWQSSRMEQISLDGGGELFRREADPVPTEAAVARVTVPSLSVDEPGEASLRLDVANRDVNQTVRLGRWNLRIIRTEVLETGLRVYVEPEAKATAKLDMPGHLAVNGVPVSSSGKLNERTQQVEWLEFPVASVMRSLNLTLTGASVTVSGPWVIEAPVQR